VPDVAVGPSPSPRAEIKARGTLMRHVSDTSAYLYLGKSLLGLLSCKGAALYLGRFFAATPASIGTNSDLGLSSRPPPCNRLWAQAAKLPRLRFLCGRCGSAAIDYGRRPCSNFSHRRQAGVLLTHGGRAAAVQRRHRTPLSAAARRRRRTPLSAAATGRGATNCGCVVVANENRCHRH